VKHCFLLSLFFLASFTCTASAAAADVIINEITYTIDETGAGQETVHIVMDPLRHPVIFGIQGEEPRVVCDFLNAEPKDTIKGPIEVNGKLIKRIRIGKHLVPEVKTRIVLDLVPNMYYTIHQIPSVEKKRFSIIVNEP
jgi:hypothetical protein